MIVLTGTGTSIGKTHLLETLLHAVSAPITVWKPYESGFDSGDPSDESRLCGALGDSQMLQPLGRFGAPLAPPHAAHAAGADLPGDTLVRRWRELRHHPRLVVELPGGLFSPVTDTHLGIDVAKLGHDALVLVAPNRLGVLQDVFATLDAAAAHGVAVHHLVLSAANTHDAAGAYNPSTITARHPALPLTLLPRGAPAELAATGALDGLLRQLF